MLGERKVTAADHMTTPTRMEAEPSALTDMILQLTLDIICLLTGETPPTVSGNHVTVKVPLHRSPTPERDTQWKILEVAKKITELLTGEVPMRCQDIAIYLSLEEREYLEGHKDLYKDAMMEDQQFPLLLDGSSTRNNPKRSSHRLSTQEGHKIPHHYETEDLIMVKVKEEPEEADVINGTRCMEEDLFLQISTDDQHSGNNTEDFSERNFTLNIHPVLHSTDPSSNLSTHGESFPDRSESSNEGHPERNHEQYSGMTGEGTSQLISRILEEPYSCFECGKCFSVKSHLIKHERVHSGEKPYLCSECGKCFTFKSNLVTHRRLHTGERPYSCCECGKSFTRKSNLIMHEKLHTGVRPYSCPKCEKCFSSKLNLLKHEKVHTGKKPHLCAECGKCFSSKADLIKHKRIHTGEKPYFCSECGRRFAYKSNQVTHSRRHTGERPYFCSECGKCFSDGSALVTHKILHTGEKPYSCPDCCKCFARKSTLNRHKSVHNGVRPHLCCECGKCFSHRYELAAHEKCHMRKKSNSFYFKT